MAILNYTTQIDSYKTLVEIQKILAKHGATKIVMDNDKQGNPVSLTFCINWSGALTAFCLPCNFVGVLAAMRKGRAPKKLCTEAQALRVGWRIIKDWIEAQMAIVEAEMATMQEVFLPYAVTKDGTSLYKHIEGNKQLLLN